MYTALAPIYDEIMSHVRYDRWVNLIIRVWNQYLLGRKKEILELGCGTGTLAQKCITKKFSITPFDLSFSMCCEAKKKNVSAFCADARSIPLKKKYPMAIFLYDGINYFDSISDFNPFFLNIYHQLETNGYFLFDVTTRYNSMTNFLDTIDAEEIGKTTYIRHSYYDQQALKQYNEFTIFTPTDNSKASFFKKECECHSQRIYSIKEILQQINIKLFEVVGVYHHFSFENYRNNSERVHFLLKKI